MPSSASTGCLPAAARAIRRDTLTLGWEERLKARARRRTDGGVEFGTALPRGTVLREGDCLVARAIRRWSSSVVERAGAGARRPPASPREWALFAYHIGNSHQPLMIGGRRARLRRSSRDGAGAQLSRHSRSAARCGRSRRSAQARRTITGNADVGHERARRCCTSATACFRSARSRTPTASRARSRPGASRPPPISATGWTPPLDGSCSADAEGPAVRGGVSRGALRRLRGPRQPRFDEVDAMRPSSAGREATRTMGRGC